MVLATGQYWPTATPGPLPLRDLIFCFALRSDLVQLGRCGAVSIAFPLLFSLPCIIFFVLSSLHIPARRRCPTGLAKKAYQILRHRFLPI